MNLPSMGDRLSHRVGLMISSIKEGKQESGTPIREGLKEMMESEDGEWAWKELFRDSLSYSSSIVPSISSVSSFAWEACSSSRLHMKFGALDVNLFGALDVNLFGSLAVNLFGALAVNLDPTSCLILSEFD